MSEFEESSKRLIRAIQRRHQMAVAVLIFTSPLVIFGAIRAIEGMKIAPEKWVSESEPERQQFEQFRAEFEGNDVVLISWEGCTVDDPRLLRFEQAILSPESNEDRERHRRDYDRVITGRSSTSRLQDSPVKLSQEAAIQRLQGTLIGTDSSSTCALVVLTYEGNERRTESIDRLTKVTLEVTQLDRDQIRIAGPPHDGVAIDRESSRGVNVFSTMCTVIAAIFCAVAIRSVRTTAVLIGIACLGQGLSLALVYYLGFTLDAILIVMPALVFILTISTGIHLVNYYVDATRHEHVDSPIATAVRIGIKPCLLSATTTAVGLGSLLVSRVTPVTVFGLLAAISLVANTLLLLAILPGDLLRKPISRLSLSDGRSSAWIRWIDQILKRPMLIVGAFLLMMLSVGAGLAKLSTSVDVLALFSSESRITRDYRWFEETIGPVVPVEVVVEFEEDHPLGFRQRVELIDQLHREMQEIEGVSGIVSALTFCPEIPEVEDRISFFRSGAIFKRIKTNREDLIAEHYLSESEGRQSWRLTGHVSAITGTDYADIQSRLKQALNPLVNTTEAGGRINVAYTGMMPLIHNIQTTILGDLFRSFLTAFVLIAIAIAIVLRNLRLTLLAMIPNLFPVLLIFGGMGWLAIPADIGTVMTASVALGIAVDDTIHFLNSYRRHLRAGVENKAAVRFAIRDCGRAMLQTTIICAAGMLMFCLSSFMPTFRFGLVMALSLLAALIGDLIFLPALLLSPLGRFSRRKRADINQAVPHREAISETPLATVVEATSGGET